MKKSYILLSLLGVAGICAASGVVSFGVAGSNFETKADANEYSVTLNTTGWNSGYRYATTASGASVVFYAELLGGDTIYISNQTAIQKLTSISVAVVGSPSLLIAVADTYAGLDTAEATTFSGTYSVPSTEEAMRYFRLQFGALEPGSLTSLTVNYYCV